MSDPFNQLAREISVINKDHGFTEPLPLVVTLQAEDALNQIRKIVGRFEALRKDPDFNPDMDNLVSSDQPGYAQVKLLLVISEIIEILDADQSDRDEEVADIFIRMLDYSYTYGVDVDAEIASKVEKNRNRPYKHGRNF